MVSEMVLVIGVVTEFVGVLEIEIGVAFDAEIDIESQSEDEHGA